MRSKRSNESECASVTLKLPRKRITDTTPSELDSILNGRNVILFGPPGIGKSTLIGLLKLAGFKAIDLEDLYPSRVRFQIPSVCSNTFIGAADLSPNRQYTNCIKVLLIAEQDAYDHRRSYRDSLQESKGTQRHHSVDEWFRGVKYHFLLNTTHLTPGEAVDILTFMLRKEPGNFKCCENLVYGKGGLANEDESNR